MHARRFLMLGLAFLILCFSSVGAEEKAKGEKKSGTIIGDVKSIKNTKDNKNTNIEVLAPGEEKPRAYFVQYDPKIKGPIKSVLEAVRAAKVGDRVEIKWAATGHGPAIEGFKVLKSAVDKDAK